MNPTIGNRFSIQVPAIRFVRCLFEVLENRTLPIALLLVLMIIAAILEACGIGLLIPYFSLMTSAEGAYTPPMLRDFIALFGRQRSLLLLGLGLILLNFFKNVLLAFLFKFKFQFLYEMQARLATRLFSHYMNADYTAHLKRHSSEALRIINADVFTLFDFVITPSFLLATESLVLAALVSLVLSISPITTLLVGGILIALCSLFYRDLKQRQAASVDSEKAHLTAMIRWIQQGLGGFKEVKVLGAEAHFISSYSHHRREYARFMGIRHAMNEYPRLFVEMIFVGGLLSLTLLAVARGMNLQLLIPRIALIVAVAMRIMPAANRILIAVSTMKANMTYLDGILSKLHTAPPDEERARGEIAPICTEIAPLAHAISLEGVEFRYPGAHNAALRSVSLTIPQGSLVAFVGPSGGGKSTIIDLILGLLRPQVGVVRVDGADIRSNLNSWRRRIGFVPQPVYFYDAPIRNNIAFGLEDDQIDERRIWAALEDAKLATFVRSLPDGLNTVIGESGARISGGQRQRIGIARALYRNPAVLILDEATTGLDNETEAEITRVIAGLKGRKTIISVIHKLDKLDDIDRLFMVSDGRIAAWGTYNDLLRDSPEFRSLVNAGRQI